MQETHDRSGFTLVEFVIVIAIIGILTALMVPSFDRYFRRQDARSHVQKIAGVLQEARSQAVSEGNNYFVLFDSGGVPGQVLVVDDDDNDWQQTGGETTRLVRWNPNSRQEVTTYGAGTSTPPAVTVPEDGGGPIPLSGTTIPLDGVTGLPAVGFNPQGIPVALGTPTIWGSGAGSYYVTDNDQHVFAVTLLPLGGVRVRGFRPGLNDWF